MTRIGYYSNWMLLTKSRKRVLPPRKKRHCRKPAISTYVSSYLFPGRMVKWLEIYILLVGYSSILSNLSSRLSGLRICRIEAFTLGLLLFWLHFWKVRFGLLQHVALEKVASALNMKSGYIGVGFIAQGGKANNAIVSRLRVLEQNKEAGWERSGEIETIWDYITYCMVHIESWIPMQCPKSAVYEPACA